MTERLQTGVVGRVRLVGGPSDLPDDDRFRLTSVDAYKVKVEHRGGYEHFERTDERYPHPDSEVIVYRWVTRTRIAE
ncbi:hypothetical protein Vqi01_18940 [Micromonospora qiuiae]|uniref:Uncharacterized protein n=1 Tax=Micromonospora qiuiae TaxID=502268 RepID=A0ABQ4J9G6_9ACTN|nr:DUF5988 family protein [Micromonospora qiuiae]GIJ26732.1 hypothetical protein Vqi01_18940 [Micromonospora qiuiae]